MKMVMSTEKRREDIVALVDQQGYVTMEDLCSLLDVSPATMRGDLEALDQLGQLIRLRGVAISTRYGRGEAKHALPTDSRATVMNHRMSDEKRTIAQLCLSLLSPNDTVFLDNSNTNYTLAAAMVRQPEKPLTAVTNSLDIFQILRYGPHIGTVLTGGDYDAATNSLVGRLAVEFLGNFRAHYAFVTARGFDPQDGVRVYYSQNTLIRQAMLRHAHRRVIIADRSKFSQPGVERLCGWEEVDILATDREPPEPYGDILRGQGIRLLAPEDGEAGGEGRETL